MNKQRPGNTAVLCNPESQKVLIEWKKMAREQNTGKQTGKQLGTFMDIVYTGINAKKPLVGGHTHACVLVFIL